MKKIILGLMFIFYGVISMAYDFDATLKVGYDFFRADTNFADKYDVKNYYWGYYNIYRDNKANISNTTSYGRGFTIGLELYPLQFLDRRIKLGVGADYNFGETSAMYTFDPKGHAELFYRNMKGLNYTDKPLTSSPYIYYPYSYAKKDSKTTFIPIYLTSKIELYENENADFKVYSLLRAGYAFMQTKYKFHYGWSTTKEAETTINLSGIYYGLGLGIQKDWFSAEILYDGRYTPYTSRFYDCYCWTLYENSIHFNSFHHKVGVRLGLQLGTKKAPKIEYQKTEIKRTIKLKKYK
ncbi:hypothetical protein [Caviibacter abscessus]|uniref:hypothetical protein n=1 Tax=Caviibacter abscessus TaxID=1766719 RepID=UPI0008356361|nr:hypothetical protein [Caviibacter abscessus]